MFDNNLKTEPIPERVFELCKIVSNGPVEEKKARQMLEPDSVNTSSTTYFGIIREVCLELKLISKENNILTYIGKEEYLIDINHFRRYCNSVVWNKKDTYFYKVSKAFMNLDDYWLKFSKLTDSTILSEISSKTGISPISGTMILGFRFWFSFLGFGYIQEASDFMCFLPNMYIALKDFISEANLEKGKEYTIVEFISKINSVCDVATTKSLQTHEINYALSNALRFMHDSGEIVLSRNLDSKEVWNLFRDESHLFISEVTHITYKGDDMSEY